jgi:hypothetical protein
MNTYQVTGTIIQVNVFIKNRPTLVASVTCSVCWPSLGGVRVCKACRAFFVIIQVIFQIKNRPTLVASVACSV